MKILIANQVKSAYKLHLPIEIKKNNIINNWKY